MPKLASLDIDSTPMHAADRAARRERPRGPRGERGERGEGGSQVWDHGPAIQPVARPRVTEATEATMLALLHRAKPAGQGYSEAARRTETALCEVFRDLPAVEAYALEQRLGMGATGDVLVVAFGRLIPERRTRLVDYLRAVRRQAAALAGSAQESFPSEKRR
ncbi:MAG: hypothetical protein H0T79_10890 [Deltaproteobacteria bacterium]|nr:hypothetical protein [Deltaproteobacteria bacterium]